MRFGGGRAVLVEQHYCSIRRAVREAGYRPTEATAYLIWHFVKVTRALRKRGGGELITSAKPDTDAQTPMPKMPLRDEAQRVCPGKRGLVVER